MYRWKDVYGLAFLGFILNMINAMAPIHEVGHVLIARLQGHEAHLTEWAGSWSEEIDSLPTMIAGYAFETAVYALFVVLCAAKASPWRWFWYGAIFATLVTSIIPNLDYMLVVKHTSYDYIGAVMLGARWICGFGILAITFDYRIAVKRKAGEWKDAAIWRRFADMNQ